MNYTLARQIHKDLRERFVAGQYLPGERVFEDKIAGEFDVSLTPVREAVKLLESDGLVVRKSHRALFTRSFTLKEAQEIYDMRALLEPHATKLVAQALDREWITSMKRVLAEQKEALGNREFGRAQSLSAWFHVQVAEQSGNRLLADSIERLWLMVPLLRALAWKASDYARPTHVIDEHQAILDGILLQPDQASQLAFEHVYASWEAVKVSLTKALSSSDR